MVVPRDGVFESTAGLLASAASLLTSAASALATASTKMGTMADTVADMTRAGTVADLTRADKTVADKTVADKTVAEKTVADTEAYEAPAQAARTVAVDEPPEEAPVPGAIPSRILMVVVTGPKRDVSMACAVGMMNLQTTLMHHTDPVDARMTFADSFDDALHALWTSDCAGAFVADCTCGFDAAFATEAMRSGRKLVLACHPMPKIDWDRVKSRPVAGETTGFVGNEYNIDVLPGRPAPTKGYARVEAVRELGVLWVTKSALSLAASRHPDIVSTSVVPSTESATRAAFCVPGVFGGRYRTAAERFLDLIGDAWTDLDHQASKMGPVAFQGCVGMRAVLR